MCNGYSEFHCAGRIYQLGLHGVRRDMSVSADHYEKATVNGHPGALGNAKTYKIEMLSLITLLLKYYLTFITERFHCTSLLDISLFRMLNDVLTYLPVPSLSYSYLGELGRLYTLGHGRKSDFNLALKYLQQGAEALDRLDQIKLN